MPHMPVNELKEGDRVDQVFLVRECRFLTTRKGQLFAAMRLGDATGVIAGIYWDLGEDAAQVLRKARYVRIQGLVGTYQNAPQVIVDSLEEAEISAEEAREMLPSTQSDVDELFERMAAIMGTIQHAHLRAFAGAILDDDELARAFRNAPAATQMHHACIGGLIEHTLSMAEAALKLCEHYTALNRDLLLVGVLIHDIGKVREFSYDEAIEYSDAGRLVGHVAIGISLVEQKARSIEGFPPRLLDLLKHYILSHHGVPEFGAIRSPMTAEALALHYIDNLDAKLAAFAGAVADPAAEGSNWTPYQRMFESYLYKGDPFAAAGSDGNESADQEAADEADEEASLF